MLYELWLDNIVVVIMSLNNIGSSVNVIQAVIGWYCCSDIVDRGIV